MENNQKCLDLGDVTILHAQTAHNVIQGGTLLGSQSRALIGVQQGIHALVDGIVQGLVGIALGVGMNGNLMVPGSIRQRS